jgi:hypothetical protein
MPKPISAIFLHIMMMMSKAAAFIRLDKSRGSSKWGGAESRYHIPPIEREQGASHPNSDITPHCLVRQRLALAQLGPRPDLSVVADTYCSDSQFQNPANQSHGAVAHNVALRPSAAISQNDDTFLRQTQKFDLDSVVCLIHSAARV